jgi:hypothetical protein
MIEPSPDQGDLLLALSSNPGLTTTWVSTQAGASVVVVLSATAVEVVSTKAVVAVVAKEVTVVQEAIVKEASATLVIVVGRLRLREWQRPQRQ